MNKKLTKKEKDQEAVECHAVILKEFVRLLDEADGRYIPRPSSFDVNKLWLFAMYESHKHLMFPCEHSHK